MDISPHAKKNQTYWDRTSEDYQRTHADQLNKRELAWGVWALPESELRVLGDVADKDILELGCGAAQWSIFLAQRGARPVGLDLSAAQLDHARTLMRAAGVSFTLVHASAESVPLPDASFDIVFCDHGAMSFSDPLRTVPEAARLLRPGGLFAFNIASPLLELCWNDAEDRIQTSLARDYFGMRGGEDEDTVVFQLPYGEWIRLFRRNRLVVEDLIELRPPPDAKTTYTEYVPLAWARRWPAENIWKLRKAQ
ncbi:MAG TPA: class I SAM-dependent methyltransferase [Candidatus Acidoferrales bacterium]|nr:class I SAM-dependent methyltransferase [Candidatus Acidoferrales bacterium]